MYKKWIGMALLGTIFAIGLEVILFKEIWKETDMATVYLVKNDLKEGRIIQNEDLYGMKVPTEEAINLEALEKSELIGKKLGKDIPAGKLIMKKDLDINTQRKTEETIILRLDKEQGHCGEITAGEVVSFLCYRQGEVKRVESLTVKRSVIDPMQAEGMAYYVTIAGDAKALEILLLAKREGSIHILKKMAVQK